MNNPKYIIAYVLIALTIGLIISFYLHDTDEKMYDAKLDELAHKSIILMRRNDSLCDVNEVLSTKIDALKIEKQKFIEKSMVLDSTLKKINKKRYETLTHVNNLSANDVSDEFSAYLDKKNESGNTN